MGQNDLAWLLPPVRSDHGHYIVYKGLDQTYPISILSDIAFEREQQDVGRVQRANREAVLGEICPIGDRVPRFSR